MTNTLIITGASQGIGASTAALFRQHNWQVINLSRHACKVPGVLSLPTDLSAPDWDKALQPALVAQLKSTDKICLVHNAAQYQSDSIVDLKQTELRQILEINLIAPTRLNQLCLPLMKAGSSIIYIGSTLAEKAAANVASYCISKHALVGLMRATCQDLPNGELHTCCICPGFTDTDMLRQHLNQDEAIRASIAGRVKANRLIQPDEIASLIYQAAQSPVLNGAVIHGHLGQIEA